MITDHFAIVPTDKVRSDLSSDEKNIYELIVKRFIAVFYPAAEYNYIKRITCADDNRFITTSNVLIKAGWLALYDNQSDAEDDKEEKLVMAAPDETAKLLKVFSKAGKTQPPALYNEATLLMAMETAGKELEDDEYANILKGKDIGTPATRAGMAPLRADRSNQLWGVDFRYVSMWQEKFFSLYFDGYAKRLVGW